MYFAASCFFMCSFLATSSTISFSVRIFVCRITLRTFFSISFSIISPGTIRVYGLLIVFVLCVIFICLV